MVFRKSHRSKSRSTAGAYREAVPHSSAHSIEASRASLFELRKELFRCGLILAQGRDEEFQGDPIRKARRDLYRARYLATLSEAEGVAQSSEQALETITALQVDALYDWVMA